MWLKAGIALLFIAMLVSLSSAFVFLMKDQTKPKSQRTLYTLGLRLGIGASILSLILYGLISGSLSYNDPFAHLK